ncbi:MAG: tRNA uridine(34) 5-carboxymethylaminomethyl modification radical SAM/GNAT enzyme Elp3 [archaeon]
MKIPHKNQIRKPTKTLSGVTPIAVMSKPRKCSHGTCLYCPSLEVPQSYTPLSPPVIRAKMLNYNPYEQVCSRLKAFKLMNHPTEKIELIIMGGTFLAFPYKYQENFIKQCYDALNSKKSHNLAQSKKLNEKAKHRCVALAMETRPDYCTNKLVKQMLKFGVTRVELGVQAISDKIYKKVNRGHTVKDVILATKLLKDSGFKVGYHIMPGLPSSNPKLDLKMFKELFSDENYRPDQLKIYPCQVIKGSALESMYLQGKYKPYTKTQTEKLLIQMFKVIPEYTRVMRVMREIPPVFLKAGTIRIDLRKDVEAYLRKKNIKLKEIRFREIGFSGSKDRKIQIKTINYNASGGKEIFIQAVNKDNIIFGLLRLRILRDRAFIRELHIYGKSAEIGKKGKIQHTGIGKSLLKTAEELVKKAKIKDLYIISGVGVREYYRKLGYKLKDEYMFKEIV